MLLLLLPLSLLSALYFYVEAMKAAMGPRRWAVAAAIAGPLLWPLFNAEKRMHWRRQAGRESVFWCP
ncbi:hypothetical protein ACFSJ3_17330 [Corallincola platygyrae]|uniref:Uncharacterized protein n=1 Tax=Corallincola platygyrae TaxID=1193278 RepID=A0ABW4XQA8_9GAMM